MGDSCIMEIVPFVRFLLHECTMSASKEAFKVFGLLEDS
jgi:hypothetical protein